MTLSSRIQNVTGGTSGGWDLFLKARAMVAAGEPVVELTIGEHDIRTAPAILQEMHRAALAGHTGYAPVPGTDALRRAVAQRTERMTGVPTRPENVTVTTGGQAALFAAHHAATDDGDAALFVDPYYATYPGTLRALGLTPVPVPARPEDGFQPREADLRAALAAHPRARSLLVNSPNNPTGAVYGPETWEGIARVVRDHDLWLISDEVYDAQVWHGRHISPRALPGLADRTLVVGSMSKSHAMTGSRVGWIVGPEAAIEALIQLSTHTTYGVPGYIQDAAAWALAQGPEFEAEVGAPFARRRALTLELLGRQSVVRAVPPEGAMYVMLDIRATGMTGEAFAHALLDAHRIAVMPGESFGTAAAGHLRVAMTVEDDTYARALSTLLDFAAERASATV